VADRRVLFPSPAPEVRDAADCALTVILASSYRAHVLNVEQYWSAFIFHNIKTSIFEFNHRQLATLQASTHELASCSSFF
jgi:hypothetical protein